MNIPRISADFLIKILGLLSPPHSHGGERVHVPASGPRCAQMLRAAGASEAQRLVEAESETKRCRCQVPLISNREGGEEGEEGAGETGGYENTGWERTHVSTCVRGDGMSEGKQTP